jgi:HPt (histidine-containing phosphotransfer) domain-containing protein
MDDEHLDHEALAELKEVMEEDFGILLSTYLSDSRMRIQALKAALDKDDPEQYAKTAHSLKGSCINIGAMKLGNLCMVAERDGRAGDLQQASVNLAAIDSEFVIVANQLSSYLKK